MLRYVMVIMTGLAIIVLAGCETTGGGSRYNHGDFHSRSYGGGP